MAAHLVEVPPPEAGIDRLARGPADPFALPNWDRAGQDGTFGNRFDDPSEIVGFGIEERFRALYCATKRVRTLGETLARFRSNPSLREKLALIRDDDETIDDVLGGVVDPEYTQHGLITDDWIRRRRMGHTLVERSSRFVDMGSAETLTHLNSVLNPLIRPLGLKEINLGAVTSQHRLLT